VLAAATHSPTGSEDVDVTVSVLFVLVSVTVMLGWFLEPGLTHCSD
jgi:hypothetical protein